MKLSLFKVEVEWHLRHAARDLSYIQQTQWKIEPKKPFASDTCNSRYPTVCICWLAVQAVG